MSFLADVFIDHDYLEADPLAFYWVLFGGTSHVARYKGNAQFPVVLSEEPNNAGQLGTWRKWSMPTFLELSEGRCDAYIRPVTYFGAIPEKSKASQLCAFVLDCDRVGKDEVERLVPLWEAGDVLAPTYVVCSGGGLHLYFVLSEPVDMMKRWVDELEAINHYLERVYEVEHPLGYLDKHNLYQSYRIVGSSTKNGDIVSAFEVGDTWSIDELALAAGLGDVNLRDPDEYKPSQVVMDRAREAVEARERRLAAVRRAAERAEVRKASGKPGKRKHPERVRNLYVGLRDVYLRKAPFYGQQGHRWNQVMCLSIAAAKAGSYVTREELTDDVRALWREWNKCVSRNGGKEIMWEECLKAIKAYHRPDKYRKMPPWFLAEKQGFEWERKTKRNGLSQEEHLEEAREWRDFKLGRRGKRWTDNAGRPAGSVKEKTPKGELIRAYAAEHPELSNRQIAEALGVSRNTVNKWLKKEG